MGCTCGNNDCDDRNWKWTHTREELGLPPLTEEERKAQEGQTRKAMQLLGRCVGEQLDQLIRKTIKQADPCTPAG